MFVVSVAREDAHDYTICFWKIPFNHGENLTITPTVKDRQWQKQQQTQQQQQAKAPTCGGRQQQVAEAAGNKQQRQW